MKKIILLLPLIYIFVQTSFAQGNPTRYKWATPKINWHEYLKINNKEYFENSSDVSIIVAIHVNNAAYWSAYANKLLVKSLSKDSSYILNRPKNIFAINTYDNHSIHFFLHGVNAKNANEYEFRVLRNQYIQLTPWTNVANYADEYASIDYKVLPGAYLGEYVSREGNSLMVDVRKKGTLKIIASELVAWGSVKPKLLNIYSANELNDFLNRLKRMGSYALTSKEKSKWILHYSANQLDANTALPKKLITSSTDNNLIFYLWGQIDNKEQLLYELTKDQKVIRNWNINEFDNSFIWLKNLKPGEYLLRMRYNIQRNNVTEYPFVIEAEWYQAMLFKIVFGFLILSYLGFAIYLIPVLRQKHKAKEELAKKEKLQLELKAIYAQLNPHFVFNALSSIQGLINKQDIQGANMYLSDFARLMRDSMTNNNKEQTTLKEEIITLDTYLKLEQLRFGFKYEIITNDVNIFETEIPSLLLQPLIENAVKHGVSTLKENGKVNLVFSKFYTDMIVEIQDNGEGFKFDEVGKGCGLKMTTDRIKLLNQIMKGQSIELQMEGNTPSGMTISLLFKNWFL